jgi:2-iminobutanoate/2-iminopropanoate deaminase
MIRAVNTDKAPEALGPYSQAIISNGQIYISGQLGLDSETNELGDTFEEQCLNIFNNIQSILNAANLDMNRLVKITIYLTDLGNFGQLNQIMAQTFSEPYPARATVEVAKLPKDALVEIDAIGFI